MEVQNNQLDPKDQQIIQKIVVKLEDWYGKSRFDTITVAWREVNSIKKLPDESIDSYINRFDAAMSNLRCGVENLPDEILAIMLLDGLNLDNLHCLKSKL